MKFVEMTGRVFVDVVNDDEMSADDLKKIGRDR